MSTDTFGHYLLTPGPLSTSERTKRAMLRDWGSWDTDFNAITARVCEQLLRIVNGADTHVCVPLQGSGTFAVEAAIGTLVGREGHVLVPSNGAYCQRIAAICRYLGRRHTVIEYADDAAVRAEDIEARLSADPTITHVALVHCETSAGLLNPLDAIARVCVNHGKRLIVDAMSSFGALPIDVERSGCDAVVAASGKCIEGVPGMGFVIVRRSWLETCAGNSHSLAMDLHDQWTYMQRTTQWRYTPPTHVVAAFEEALKQFWEEGGCEARGARYARNCDQLIRGMEALGFTTFLPRSVQAPIIVTFHSPPDPNYDFKTFYARMKAGGYIIYPGKLTRIDTFRMGCIGQLGPEGAAGAVRAVAAAIAGLGIRVLTPARSAALG
jgi:2-aminoethylphosphonate-pyruvate transaminase